MGNRANDPFLLVAETLDLRITLGISISAAAFFFNPLGRFRLDFTVYPYENNGAVAGETFYPHLAAFLRPLIFVFSCKGYGMLGF